MGNWKETFSDNIISNTPNTRALHRILMRFIIRYNHREVSGIPKDVNLSYQSLFSRFFGGNVDHFKSLY